MTQEDKIKAHVEVCIDKYKSQCGLTFRLHVTNEESRQHIIQIGTSVLNTLWKVGYPGGSFVQAIVNNDLREAFNRADNVNQDCIKFYVMLMINSEYIN